MIRTLRRAALSLVAVLGLTLSLSACISTPGGGAAASDPNAVKIGTLRAQPHLFSPYFMQQFAPEGTTYEVVLFDSSPDIKNALTSGAIQFGVLGAASILAGAAADEDVKIIGSAANGGSGFVGRPEIQSVADLHNKKIGYPAGAIQEIQLKLTLEANGLNPDTDVQLVNLPFSDMANAYTSGQIDAFLSAETAPSIVMQQGAHQIASPYDTPLAGVNLVFATTGAQIDRDPARVQTAVDSFAQAIDFMKSDNAAWVDGVVDTFGLDRAVTETATKNIGLRWELDEAYRAQVASLADQMVKFDQLSGVPDMGTIFDTTFADAVTARRGR
jgi:NitT/TauT family transport system substrate-binding protein